MKRYSKKSYKDTKISRRRIADAQYQIRYYKDSARCFRDMAAAKEVALSASKLAQKAAKLAKDPAAAQELSFIQRLGEKVAAGKERISTLALRIKNAVSNVLSKIATPFKAAFEKIANKLGELKDKISMAKARMELNKMINQRMKAENAAGALK